MPEVNFLVKKGLTVPKGSAATPAVIFDASDPNTGIYSPGADQLAISTSGTQRINIEADGDINIDSGGVFYDATNNRLAIGTTSPSEQLHLTGSLYAESRIYAADGAAATPSIRFYNSNVGLYSPGSSALGFSTGSSERARIDSSGRLLVGTSSALSDGTANPSLAVAGGTNDTSRILIGRYAIDNSPAQLTLCKSRASVGSQGIVLNGNTLGVLNFAGSDGAAQQSAAVILAAVDGTPGANDMPGRLVFSVTADGAASPTEAMRIKNSRIINIANTPTYADNAAAKAGGLVDGDVYRTATGALMIVYT